MGRIPAKFAGTDNVIDWDKQVVAADLEASGRLKEYALQPWRLARGDCWITSASMIRRHPTEGLVPHLSQLFPTKAQLMCALQDTIDNDWIVLGWNIAYDISMLMALGPDMEDLCMRVSWLDGMLMERHYDIEPEYEFQTAKHLKKSYSLKGYTDSSGRVFPGAVQRWIPSFAGLDEDVDFHATDPASLAKLQRYNDRDNVRTWTIASMIWQKLSTRQQAAVLIQAACLPVVAQGNLYGLDIDQLACRHLGAKLDVDAAKLLSELAPDGITEAIVRSPAQLGNLMFNPASPTPEQIAQGITPGWQLPVLKENKSKDPTKPNTRSTDKEVLHELAFIDPRAAKIKAYRETLNARGKFNESVLESVAYNEDGKTHPVARLFGTYSDRLTIASKQGKGADARPIGFALHQMKREAEFREIVTVPPGYDMVEFDAAGQEYRWMAIASNDATMLNLCMPGEDAHSYMGAAIVGMPYKKLQFDFENDDKSAKNNRYLGKFGNLSCQYRIGAKKLRSKARVDYDIPLELPEAQRIHATYQREYPGVPVYWTDQIAKVRGLGYVETFAGSRVQVVGDWEGDWGWSMGSTAINARIQGTGAEQKHLALKVIKNYLRQFNGRFLFDLHDGAYAAFPSAVSRKAVDIIKRELDNLPYQREWGFAPPIPLPWDAKLGKAWGRLKSVHFD